MSDITITVRDVRCPRCGAGEIHPADINKPVLERRVLIRGFKVSDEHGRWWSECLVCSNFYDENLNVAESPTKKDGWFCDDTKPLPIGPGTLVLISKDGRSLIGQVTSCSRWGYDWDLEYRIMGSQRHGRWKQNTDGGVVRVVSQSVPDVAASR